VVQEKAAWVLVWLLCAVAVLLKRAVRLVLIVCFSSLFHFAILEFAKKSYANYVYIGIECCEMC